MPKETELLPLPIEDLKAENAMLRKRESDRKQALNLLAESERRISTLMANLPGMAYRCLDDESWTMEFVSDGCLELTGFPPDHLLENRRTSYAEIIHPEDRKMVREQAKISLDKRSQFNLTYRIITAGGQEKWVIEKGQGVFSDSGDLLAIEGFITEITERRRAEEAQRQGEGKFRLAFQTSPDAINLNRLSDGMYIDINEGFTKLTGFTREDVSGKTSLELSVWDDPKDREHLVKHLMAEGFVRNFEARFRGKSGQIKTALMSARVLELGKEKVILSITLDITDYKRTEETLRASQALIEGIINAIPVRVFWKDMNLVYLGCNEAFARDAGFAEPKEIVGKDDYQMGWRDRADQYRGDDRDVIDSGCSKFLIEEPLTTPEGNTVTLLTNKIPLRNAKGKITGVLGTYIDISERKRTEEALKQSEHSAMRFAQEKEILAEIGRIISSDLNIEEVYERFAAEMKKIISFDRIAINLVNLEKKTVVVQYVSGTAIDGRAVGDEFPLLGTTTAKVVESGRGMMIPTLADQEIESRFPGYLPLRRAGMKSTLLAPLIAKGQAFGALVLLSAEPNKYNTADIAVAENVAAQISGAIANALLLLECKRAEEALRKSEDQYRDLVEHSQDLICTHDLEGRLLSANTRVSAVLGYEPDVLLKMNLRDCLVPEERGKFENYLQEIRTHGQAQGLMFVRTKTGKRRIWEYNNTLRTEGVAEPIVRGMAHDITERKLAEDAFRESQVRLHTIIQTEPECVKVVASDGTLMEMNAAGLRMIEADSAQACVGKSVYQIVAPEHRSAFQAMTEKVCAGEDGTLEFEIVGLKGSRRWLDTHATPLRDARGKIIGALGITRDITERKMAEEALRDSERRHRRILEALSDAFLLRSGGVIIYTNPAALKLFRANDPADLIGKQYLDLVHPDDRALSAEREKKYMDENLALSPREHRILALDGQVVQVESIGGIVKHRGETQIFGVFRDITERKQSEHKLYDALTFQKTLLENLNVGVLLVDAETRVIENANPAAAKLIAAPLEEIVGRMCHRFICPAEAGRCPVVDLGQKTDVSERTLMRADGVSIPVLKSVNVFRVGGETKLLEVIVDNSERKRAEAALRESEERFRLAFENANIGMCLVDTEGRLIRVNRQMCEIFGYSTAEFEGMNVNDITHPDHLDVSPAFIQRAKNKDIDHSEFEKTYVHKQGRLVWGHISSTLVRNVEGDPMYFISHVVDITERKRAEQEREKLEAQFRQAQKMEAVGRLSGGVAHDFNNMLGVILGFTDLAITKLAADDPIRMYLEEVRTAAQRSADITRQLLAFARKQIIAPEVLDLNDTIANMLKMLRRLIGEDIDLLWKPAKDLWPVKMDPAQIDQLLANLVVNARDAIEGVGKITIETGKAEFDAHYCETHDGSIPGRHVMLAVGDDGCGMDKETLAKIFEPFFTTKEVGKGTGLGLATVYGIVKQNNGFIDVHSEPGKGTTFKIYLPRQEPQEAATEPPRRPVEVPTGTETVLLVEDEKPLLKFARMLLEQLGYTVLASGSPKEAIRMARGYANEIHLLMTDVVMPGMSGRDLCGQLEADRPGLKCLFMSGYTADVIAHQGVLDEGIHFLQKPFSREALATKIREALS
jgi:PAS domain S-box-containing protein